MSTLTSGSVTGGSLARASRASERAQERLDHELDLVLRHAAVQGKRQQPRRNRIGDRQRPSGGGAVARERVDRRVVDARLDAALGERGAHLLALGSLREENDREMVRRRPLLAETPERNAQAVHHGAG